MRISKIPMVKEPFLINPARRLKRKIKRRKNLIGMLMLVNKRRRKKYIKKRGGIKMRKRRTRRLTVTGRRGRVKISPASRLAPRSAGRILNPFASVNRRRIRRYRRNPVLSLPLVGRISTREEIPNILGLTGGFVTVKAVPSMVFPINWQVGLMRPVSQLITAVGGSLIANRFLGRKVGKMFLYGGILAMTTELAGQLLVKVGVPLASVNGMGLYLTPEQMGYYYTPQEA